MKWLFALLLAAIIFGSAAFFGYHIIVKPELAVRAEQKGEGPLKKRVRISAGQSLKQRPKSGRKASWWKHAQR
jgi:hypothetical protein